MDIVMIYPCLYISICLDELGEETCYSGNGIIVNETSPQKWTLNWVEIYEQMEKPFEGKLKYVLPLEAPDDIVDLDFANPKFFMPAQSHPVFELTIFKGKNVLILKSNEQRMSLSKSVSMIKCLML